MTGAAGGPEKGEPAPAGPAPAGPELAGPEPAGPEPAGPESGAAESGGPVRITLLTRPGCHLCVVAAQALERVRAVTGAAWLAVDVTTDQELEREYGDRLPVILVDGVEHGYWRVEEPRLIKALAR